MKHGGAIRIEKNRKGKKAFAQKRFWRMIIRQNPPLVFQSFVGLLSEPQFLFGSRLAQAKPKFFKSVGTPRDEPACKRPEEAEAG